MMHRLYADIPTGQGGTTPPMAHTGRHGPCTGREA